MKEKKLLIADDSEINRAVLANVLEEVFDILEVSNGKEAIAALQAHEGEIAALLLDVVMPEMDGFGVLAEMNRRKWIEDVPTIMISAETSGNYIDRAFKLGASDYVSRPFVPSVIHRRIMNTILLHTKKQRLMDLVAGRFYQREKNNDMLVAVLSYAVELRSGDGGSHMTSVGHLTGLLLHRLMEQTDRYSLDHTDADAICIASSLHDIGKLLIPEDILTKPNPLTPEEYEIVKHHTQIGAKIITGLPVYRNEKFIKYAIQICRWHHERWNGEGYPDGLKGDEIPIAAQVVSVADVYNALTSKRCYKDAYSHEKALAMINGGECGTFNPLLLECLNDLSNTLQREQTVEVSDDAPYRATQQIIEDLYTEQNTSARMIMRLEEEYSKRRFFSDLTDDLWFEYTTHPDSLSFSSSAVAHTGLPRVLVDPLRSAELRTIVSEETLTELRSQIRALSTGETHLEMDVTLTLDGRPRRCLVVMQITWSAAEPGQCSSLIGQIRDIDDRLQRLEEFAQAPKLPLHSALMPVATSTDHVLRITGEQVTRELDSYRQMFETVRLVDPSICMQLTDHGDGPLLEKSERCFSIWGKSERCERCISLDVVRTRTAQTKVEAVGDKVFYVLAVCVEIDGTPYALELVNPIRIDDMRGSEDESVLNQLLVRNRQIYTDSATKVYNRRYYDERLRSLDGEYAMAMIDTDNFKHINDRYGHLAGDTALYHTAQAIRSEIRTGDELVRYGGDEFFLLFHDMPHHSLEKKLENIRHAVECIRIPEYPELRISASIGGAYADGPLPETMHKADLALYRSKIIKNSVTLYQEKNDHDHP